MAAASITIAINSARLDADVLIFGDADSEKAHAVQAALSDVITGGLGDPARRLLPAGEENWAGGRVQFTIGVDPEKPNHITLRLWGSDTSPNRLVLFVEGKQIGYQHLGDIETMDIGGSEAAYRNRFLYRTTPLPRELTRGKTQLACEIRSIGPIWGYGQTFDKYQKPMTQPTRGLYRVVTHTDGFYAPSPDEKQGDAAHTLTPRKEPGTEVIDAVKARVNKELTKLLAAENPLNQMELEFLAQAWHVVWTTAHRNPQVIERVIAGADRYYEDFKKNPRIAEAGPSSWNPEWFGLGPIGDVVRLLADELKPHLDEKLPSGITRRAAWSEMLVYSRDWHRRHRRLYTNQSMINDLYGIYLSNRGVAVVDPVNAVPEMEIRRYLYESVGLEPWRDSDPGGTAAAETKGKGWNVGSDYLQLTQKGLTKELGYVGNYGEVLDWMTAIYNATRPLPGQPGDEKLKAQLVKAGLARSFFRHPSLDADGHRAMRLETIIGWRDSQYPGDITYAQRNAWDGSAIQSATATLDPKLIGYAQQMLADNQYFASVRERMKTSGLRVTMGLLDTPEEYEILRAQPPSPHRLPMSDGQPDFIFTDEENGVVALKHGDEILYASLYWRARYAINFLARIHYLTPRFDRIATVHQETLFAPSGLSYKRPDWTNFGFGGGGVKYPGELLSAHAGEVLPIPKIPEGVKFKPGDESVYAGKGSFYTLRYGPYLIGMNTTPAKTFRLGVPSSAATITDLATRRLVTAGSELEVGPRSTVVLRLEP